MSKYYGNWSTNNGNTSNAQAWESDNKSELAKDLREACEGNLTGPHDIGRWSIVDKKGDLVKSGVCRW